MEHDQNAQVLICPCTHIHGLAAYVKEELPFTWDLSLENCEDSYLCFQVALLHSKSYFSFLCRSPFSSLCLLIMFHYIHNRIPCFITLLINILVLIGTVFVII